MRFGLIAILVLGGSSALAQPEELEEHDDLDEDVELEGELAFVDDNLMYPIPSDAPPVEPLVEVEVEVAEESIDEVFRFEDGHTGEMVEIPREWLATPEWAVEVPEIEGPTPSRHPETLEIVNTPRPLAWMPRNGPSCQRYRGRRVCDGPLHVARPFGLAAARAVELGLGVESTADYLLGRGPTRPWILAAREASDPRRARTLRFPVERGFLGRGVGMVSRRNGRGRRMHKGVDIGAAAGTRVLSANDGIVAYANNGVRGYGNLIMVIHPDATVTFYAHLQAVHVFPGMRVLRGQVLGEVGSTGLSSGPHLHFEWRAEGVPRDPQPRFRAPPGTMAHH